MRAVVVGVLVTATLGCAGGSESGDSTAPPATGSDVPATATEASAAPSVESSPGSEQTTTTEAAVQDGPLAEVCPERIVVQTQTLPSPELGPLYSLLGPDPQVDVASASVAGPLVRADGVAEDVVLEIRSGGPAVGFLPSLDLLAADPAILLAQASTSEVLRAASETRFVGVVNLTDRSRDVIIVDPQTYPEVESIDAVRDVGIEVRHTTDDPFIAFLGGTGALDPAQLVPGFDGEPAAFVQAGGAIAQQGNALVDPVLIPSLPQWARPVSALDATSSGWVDYDDALVVRRDDLDARADCLGRLVPVIQAAVAAYPAVPHDANAVMSIVRAQFAPLTRLNVDLMDAGVREGIASGVFGDGSDATAGNFDIERLEPFVEQLADVLGVDEVAVDDLVTNEFIDPTLTSGG